MFIRTNHPKIQTSNKEVYGPLVWRSTSLGQLDSSTTPSNPGEHFVAMTFNGNYVSRYFLSVKEVHLMNLPTDLGITGHLPKSASLRENYYSVNG